MDRTGRTVIVAGNSLKAGILALLLDRLLPHSDVTLVCDKPTAGGRRQLPILFSAIPKTCADLFDPLIVKAWPAFRVEGAKRFERYDAQMVLLAGEQLHLELLERFAPNRLRLSSSIAQIAEHSIRLATGEIIGARDVIDVRNPRALAYRPEPGRPYHLVIRDRAFEQPHGMAEPVLFKKREQQEDGILFSQYLPLTDTMVREILYSPNQRALDLSENIAATEGTILRMERGTIAREDLFDGAHATQGAEAIDFAKLLDGGIGDLVMQAGEVAARQIRIVA